MRIPFFGRHLGHDEHDEHDEHDGHNDEDAGGTGRNAQDAAPPSESVPAPDTPPQDATDPESLAAVARGCGIENVMEIRDLAALPALAAQVQQRNGCLLAQVFVRAEPLARALPPRDGVHLKNRFRAALGLETF